MSDYDKLKTIACPHCNTTGSIELSSVLAAKPIGTYSLAGAQTKVSAIDTPALKCVVPGCQFVKLPSK